MRTIAALERHECLALLQWEAVGRLAVAAPGEAPTVVPVNFVLDGETILFRTGDGQKVDRLRENPVSFQVDRLDSIRRVGWSVLVQGAVVQVPPDLAGDDRLESWAPGERQMLMRIEPTLITGRRLEVTHRLLDGRAYL